MLAAADITPGMVQRGMALKTMYNTHYTTQPNSAQDTLGQYPLYKSSSNNPNPNLPAP